jgi:acetyl-CoA/propionyl-CoA carboxylase biotin carboxyl carrier protein
LVVWGRDRAEAIARIRRALAETVVEGVPTTIPFDLNVMNEPEFAAHGATTAYLPEHPEVIPPPQPPAASDEATEKDERRDLLVEVNNRQFRVSLPAGIGGSAVVAKNGDAPATRRPVKRDRPGHHADQAELSSPLQGVVVRVAVDEGQRVSKGDLVCVVEAMKMENEITAHRDGVISKLTAKPGETIKIGAHLVSIEP